MSKIELWANITSSRVLSLTIPRNFPGQLGGREHCIYAQNCHASRWSNNQSVVCTENLSKIKYVEPLVHLFFKYAETLVRSLLKA